MLVHPEYRESRGDIREGTAFRVKPSSKIELDQMFDAIAHEAIAGVVHLWALDGPANESLSPASLLSAQSASLLSIVHVLQRLEQREAGATHCRLWLATRGAQSVDAAAGVAVAQAPVWGLARSLAQEQPELFGGIVDLPAGDANATNASPRRSELGGHLESRSRITKNRRFAARFRAFASRRARGAHRACCRQRHPDHWRIGRLAARWPAGRRARGPPPWPRRAQRLLMRGEA